MVETKFKQTDVGLIPEDWEVKSVGEIGEIRMCKRVMKYETSEIGEVPFYKIGTFGSIPDAYITYELFREYRDKYSYPRKGDILVSAAGTIGRTVIFDGNPSYFQDSNIVWVENNEKIVTNKFLYYIYRTIDWNTSDTTIKRLYNDNFRGMRIPLPSLEEQERIASALTSIDNLISSLDKQIAKTRNIKQGAMQQLLTSFHDEASFKFIDEVAKIIRGVRVTKGQLMQNGKYPVVSGGTGYMGYINEYNREPNTITIAQYGTAGYVNWQEQKFWANDICYCIIPNTKLILNNYLYYSLENKQEYLYSISNRDATPYSIDRKKILNVRIPVPSIEEQQRIASTLTAMDNQIAALEAKRRKYEMLKQGMMQQLLTGKIRLSR